VAHYTTEQVTNAFIIGDARRSLKKIPSGIARCIVTSPPYFGQRDYGTAIWVGGDPACEHSRATNVVSDGTASSTLTGGLKNQVISHSSRKGYNDICKKCGAIRVDNQLGLERTPRGYIQKLKLIFRECRRILSDDGTLWVNIGDCYASTTMTAHNGQRKSRNQAAMSGLSSPAQSIGLKPKNLIGIPWMLAFALRDDGWYLRSDIIWNKPNPLPESVNDRPTKSHEYIFLLSKSKNYYYDAVAIRTPLAESVLRDKRLYDDSYTTGRPKRGYPGQSSHGAGLLKSKNINAAQSPVPGQAGSTAQAGMQDLLTANKKTVWTIATKPFDAAHFATFPEDLIVDPIKAGTSQRGHCSGCGKPWQRITLKELKPTAAASYNTKPDARDRSADANDQGSNRVRDGHKPGHYNEYTTQGWEPSCACDQSTVSVVPDLVFDPFGGAATTALVAAKLGRDFLITELSETYVKDISVPRLQAELGFFFTPKIISV
jgi:DNA modification methylase